MSDIQSKCLHCTTQADGEDRLCRRCRAESASTWSPRPGRRHHCRV